MVKPLRIVALEILEGCNLFCDFCVRNALNNLTNKVTMENYEKFLTKLREFPEKPDIALTGGEPFLQRGLIDIVKKTDEYGFNFSITTNATIRNKEVINFCANSEYFKHFIISIDSCKPDVHDSIRGPKAFTRSMNFIDYIKDRKVPFGINMTVSDTNYHDVDETIKFANEIGAKDISVATVKPNGRGEATFTLEKLKYVSDQILKNKSLINDNFKLWATEVTFFLYDMDTYRDDIESGETGSCAFASSTLHVRANGVILGCTACEDIVLGNVFKHDNPAYLKNVWENNITLNEVRSKENLKGICKTCDFKEFCGGCRCRANGVNGDLFSDDPYCPIVIEKESVPS